MNLIYIYAPWGVCYNFVRMSGSTSFLFDEAFTFGRSFKCKIYHGEPKDAKPFIK